MRNTIKDVAKLANVSVATVSRVINNRNNVSSDVKYTVEQAIRELGYIPNNAARTLVKKQTDTIAVLLRSLHSPFFSDFIHGIDDAAKELDRNIIYCSLGEKTDTRDRYIKYLTNGIADGVIIYGSLFTDKEMIEQLQRVNFPFLLIENNFQSMHVDQFLVDNLGGAKRAVEYLLHLNHRNIAYFVGNPNKKVILERLTGYLEAMQDNGLFIRDSYIQYTANNGENIREQVKALMSMNDKDRPTAIFCSSDKIAIKVINALIDMQYEVPKDVSVIGFDSITSYDIHYKGPKITSVKQPLYEMGYDSIMTIHKRLAGADQQVNREYKTVLTELESVLPIST